MLYFQRKINSKNDIIWAFDIQSIPEHIRYNRVARNPGCIGVFIVISNFGVFFDIKDEGQSWNNVYSEKK